MARSFDNRRFPAGPIYGPDGKLIMRGPRRKLVGRVTPGDDVEVSREIERLWEWHTRLQTQNSRLLKRITDLQNGDGPPYVLNPGDVAWDPAGNPCGLNGDAPDVSGGGGPVADWLVPSLADAPSTTKIPVGNAGALAFNFYPMCRIGVAAAQADNYQLFVERETSPGTWISEGIFYTVTNHATTGEYAAGQAYDSGWQVQDSTATFATVLAGSCGNLRIGVQAANGNGGFAVMMTGVYIALQWVYLENGVSSDIPTPSAYVPPGGGAADDGLIPVWNGSAWEVADETNANARVGARINTGGTTYERRRINFIEGTGIDLSAADDSVNEEIDVTLAVDPTELDITTLGGMAGAGLLFLADDGTFKGAGGGRLNAVLYGTPALGTTRFVAVPRGASDTDVTIDLERLHLRTETPSSSGDVVAKLQKAPSGETAPAWTDVGTITLPVGEYEVDLTIGAYTVTSDDLLRLYFSSIGTGCTDYQALVTGTRES